MSHRAHKTFVLPNARNFNVNFIVWHWKIHIVFFSHFNHRIFCEPIVKLVKFGHHFSLIVKVWSNVNSLDRFCGIYFVLKFISWLICHLLHQNVIKLIKDVSIFLRDSFGFNEWKHLLWFFFAHNNRC